VLVSLTPHHLLGVGMALASGADSRPRWISGGVPGAARAEGVARFADQELFLLVILAICLGTGR